MPPVVVRRPDGSLLRVSSEEADRLEVLGYRRQTAEEGAVASTEDVKHERLTTPGQKALTVLEGLGSGASLGLTDLAGITAGGESNERAEANPGYRLASELLGGIGPALAPASVLGKVTPAGQLARGSEAVTAGIERTSLRRAAQAGLEAEIQGAGSAITHAQLTDEPVSVESVIAAAGWSGLFGFGLGGAAGKLEGTANRMAVRSAAEKVEREAAQSLAAAPEVYSGFRGAVDDVVAGVDDATKAIDGQLEELRKASYRAEKGVPDRAPTPTAAAEDIASAEAIIAKKQVQAAAPGGAVEPGSRLPSVEEQMAEAEAARTIRGGQAADPKAAEAAWKRVQAEARVGRPKALKEALDQWRTAMGGAPEGNVVWEAPISGGPPARPRPSPLPDVDPIAQSAAAERVLRADKAMKSAADLVAVREAIKDIPRDLKGFLRMKPDQFERVAAALEKIGKVEGISEVAVKSLAEQMDALATSAGIKSEGNVATTFRATWDTLRTATTNGNLAAAAKLAAGEGSKKSGLLGNMLKQAAGFVGWRKGYQKFGYPGGVVGRKLAMVGAGYLVGGLPGASLAATVTGIRASTLARLRSAVGKFGPGIARKGRAVGARAIAMKDRWGGDDPLRVRLDGSYDDTKDDRQAAVNRLHEVAGFLPASRDTIYRTAAEFEKEGHPDFAAAVHSHMVRAMDILFQGMPKDPGTVLRGGRSQWRPDEVQVEQVRRAAAVFHDPVGEMERMLESGHVIPSQVQLLDLMWPALLMEARQQVYERLGSDPEWLPNQDITVQAAVSTFLGVPLHSSMRPEFVVAQQAMFAERTQPRPPSEAYPEGGGRPPGPDKNTMATQAQRITEH